MDSKPKKKKSLTTTRGKSRSKVVRGEATASDGSPSLLPSSSDPSPLLLPDRETPPPSNKNRRKSRSYPHSMRGSLNHQTPHPRPSHAELEAMSTCATILQEFIDDATAIFTERFIHCEDKAIITYDLRNTWLRIMEMEWLDLDLLSGPKSKLFPDPDESPPAHPLDPWSRGTLLEFPNDKRESYIDSDLRDYSQAKAGEMVSDGSVWIDGSLLDPERADLMSRFSPDELALFKKVLETHQQNEQQKIRNSKEGSHGSHDATYDHEDESMKSGKGRKSMRGVQKGASGDSRGKDGMRESVRFDTPDSVRDSAAATAAAGRKSRSGAKGLDGDNSNSNSRISFARKSEMKDSVIKMQYRVEYRRNK